MVCYGKNHSNTSNWKKTYPWELTLYENQGKLCVKWTTDAPFRAQQDKCYIYADSFPNKPGDRAPKWQCWINPLTGSLQTDLLWGSNWYGAIVAEEPPNEAYTYVVKAGPTVDD